MKRGNLFAAQLDGATEEQFDELVGQRGLRIERIVSRGHRSAPGFWYDQPQDEWVAVLRGRARIEIEGRSELIELGPGDWLEIPARQRHRVAWTSADEPTIWLAVHY